MRYLITGTNGFIGRSLVARLCEDSNNEIFAVDLSLDKLAPQSNIVRIYKTCPFGWETTSDC